MHTSLRLDDPLKYAIAETNTSGHRFVALLYFSLVGIALAIAAYHFLHDYRQTRAELEERAAAYSLSMATDVRWYVDVAEQTLRRVAEHVTTKRDNHDYSTLLSQALGDLPVGVVIAVFDANGESFAFLGQTGRPVNVSDRHYFQSLREGEKRVVSNLISDRVTGKKTFAVGIPLTDADGGFQGAAVAYAPMEAFHESWLSVGGTNSNAFIVHRDGWITARLPPLDSEVYDNPVSHAFAETFFAQDRGIYWAPVSPIDGIARVLGYARVPNTQLSAVIGVSPDDAMRRYWTRVGLTGATLAPVLALFGLFAWRGRNLIKRQEDTAMALAQSHARNEGLLLEIHHRVKNNLQSALALFRIHVKEPSIIAEIEPRILAMVAAHEHIYRNDGYHEVSARSFITGLAEKTIYAASRSEIELITDIPEIPLRSEIVMPLGQLVNEAVINATKYGFPDGRSGCIVIKMTTDHKGMANLTIHDDGNPLPDIVTKGMGTRLVNSFAVQLNGQIHTTSNAEGVTVAVTFPLAPNPR